MSSSVGEHIQALEGRASRRGLEAPHTTTPTPYISLWISSIWLLLNCILYRQLIDLSAFLISVSHSKKSNLRSGVMRTPNLQLVDQMSRWQPGTCSWWSEVGPVLWDWALHLRVRCQLLWLASEWNCKTPGGIQRIRELAVVIGKHSRPVFPKYFPRGILGPCYSDQQSQSPLGTGWKCKISGTSPDLLLQIQSFTKILKWCICTLKFENHCGRNFTKFILRFITQFKSTHLSLAWWLSRYVSWRFQSKIEFTCETCRLLDCALIMQKSMSC